MRKRIEVVDAHLYDKVDAIRRIQGGTIASVGRRLITERLTQLESQQASLQAAAGGTQGSAGKDSKDQSLTSPVGSGN